MPSALARLFSPGAAQTYSPQREAMFAQLLGSQSPVRGWGDVGANLARAFIGARGLKSQRMAGERDAAAQQEQLAAALGGVSQQLGIPAETLTTLAGHPLGKQVVGELLTRTRAPEPQPDPTTQAREPVVLYNQAGESRSVGNWDEASRAHGEGFTLSSAPEAPEAAGAPEVVPVGGVPTIYDEASGTFVRAPVGPGVAADLRAAAAPSPSTFKPTNVTMPDGSTRLVLSQDQLMEAQQAGAVLPQGGTQQRPLTEVQMRAKFAVDRMEPSLQTLFSPQADGSTLYDKMSEMQQRAAAGIPGDGNYLVTPEYQQAENAVREAVGALLRFETGAAITQQEVEDQMHRYSPRPGDSPQVIEQKKGALINALSGVKSSLPQQGQPMSAPAAPQGGMPDFAQMSDEELRRIAAGVY